MDKQYQITKKRKEDLEKELNYLKTTRTREVEAMIAEAMMYGDLDNNSEYDAAKSEQLKLLGRIAEIEKILSCAVVIEAEEKHLSEAFLSELSKRIQDCGLSAQQAESYVQYCQSRFEQEEQAQYGTLPADSYLETLKEAQRIISGREKSSGLDWYTIDRFLQVPSNQWQAAKAAIVECFGCTRETVDTFYNEEPERLFLTADAIYESAEYLKKVLSDKALSWKIFQRGAIFGRDRFHRISAILELLGEEFGLKVIRADAEAYGWICWGYYSDPVECIAYMKECGLTPEKILTLVQQEPNFLYMYKTGRKLSYCHNQEYIDRIIQRYQ